MKNTIDKKIDKLTTKLCELNIQAEHIQNKINTLRSKQEKKKAAAVETKRNPQNARRIWPTYRNHKFKNKVQ